MSYLLVIARSLIFLFLWSKLPDPTRPQPETLNSLPDREATGCRARRQARHEGRSCIPINSWRRTTAASGCSPTGMFKAVLTVLQPSPRPPYCPSKLSEELTLTVTGTFLSHGREPGTITSSGRCGTTISFATTGERRQSLRKERSTMNCPRCGNDQWGKSRDSFGREDIVCVNCGLPGQPAIEALVHDWVTNHKPPEATIQAGSASHLVA